MTGLSSGGMTIKRLDEIKTELDEGLRFVFGQELSLDPSTPESQMNGILAEEISLIYEMAQAVYAGLNPNYAVGNMLDLVSQIRGVIRKPATATEVTVVLLGSANLVIQQGALFSTVANPEITFSLTSNVALNGLGTATGLALCSVTGKVAVPANTLTEIVNPVSGLDSVTNPLEGIQGNDLETDEDLRRRSNASVALPALAILEGMQAAIINIPNVTSSKVYENNTSVVDPITAINPKSMRAIVEGGSEQDIADVIFNRKSLGCGMDGLITVQVDDVNGFSHNIRFDRPVLVEIHIALDLKELAGWDPAQIVAIEQAVVDFANGEGNCAWAGYQVGESVYASQLYSALLGMASFSINSILVDIATPALGSEVILDYDELAVFDVINITTVSAP